MSAEQLHMGSLRYDQFDAIDDGRVRISGIELRHTTSSIATDIFEPAMNGTAFDIAELGLTYYLRSLDFEDPPFIALPVFPARAFRHSAIYVNTRIGINEPADLIGKTIGEFVTYGHDGGVWAKGILGDDFGVSPNQSSWVVGALDRPMAPVDYIPFLHPADVRVRVCDPGVDLGSLLERGEIDALVSGNVPQAMRSGSPEVARLFNDFVAVEREWFARTRIFPPAHVMVVRRGLLDRRPELAQALFDAFVASKALALQSQELGRVTNFVDVMVPWLNDLVEENRTIGGNDWWSYGVASNRKAIAAFLRYHFEQGLSRRQWRVEEIFAAGTLQT